MNTALLAKQSLIEQNQTLLARFKAKTPIEELVTQRCQFVDSLIKQAWLQHGLDQYPIALIAVGGYGRGELHPHSDVDLLFLFEGELAAVAEAALSEFIAFLWDASLEIGHSVRTLDDTLRLGRDDITIATNLMEMRYLAGNQQLFDSLQVEVSKDNFWPSKDFFQAKRHEQQGRHAQYHGTAYNLEPNLKANPGGLRDIQTIGWVAKKHFRTRTMRELVAYQYLTEDEYQELMECEAYLWQMRFALHLEAGRNENRILFDYQPAVARWLGFGDDGKASVERMMKRFFRTVHALSADDVERLCNYNYENEVGFVAVVGPREQEEIIGQACYFSNPATNLADVAYLINPKWQSTGLGSALQQRILEHAQARGVRGFVADILPSNTKMIALAKKATDHITVEKEDDSLHVTMMFE